MRFGAFCAARMALVFSSSWSDLVRVRIRVGVRVGVKVRVWVRVRGRGGG